MNDNNERFVLMLQELGEAMQQIDAIVQQVEDEGIYWAVQFDDDSVTNIELLDEKNEVQLTTSVGKPAEDRKIFIYEQLLSYNHVSDDFDGAKVAFSQSDGELLLLRRIFNAESLSMEQMRDLLLEHTKIASAFSAFVASEEEIVENEAALLNTYIRI
jgi:hypothetical protein